MGIRAERQQIFNYSEIYKNISFSKTENSFSFSGQLKAWENVEITSRIFYKKLEALLYGDEIRAKMNDDFIIKMLTATNQKDYTILDLIKKHDYSIESLHSFFMEVLDYVYFSVKKQLPYTIGGGIGQSRVAMFILGSEHIAEVQASSWQDKTIEELKYLSIL